MSDAARPIHVSLALVATVMAATACTSGGGEESTSGPRRGDATAVAAPSASQAEAAEVVWRSDLQPLGQPVEAGPALLVLAKSPGGVRLVSLDKGSGKQNFAVPFHPGGLPLGVAMTPRATTTYNGRHLAIVRRDEPSAPGPALVALDVRSGDVVRSADFAIDDYDACSDGTDVCWSGYPSREGGLATGPFGTYRETIPGSAPVRWDLETGRIVEGGGPEGARQVGTPDLYAVGEGRTSSLVRVPGTRRTSWSQSVSLAVADGADASYGWAFDHDDEANVFVGSLGRPVPPALVNRFNRGAEVELSLAQRYVTVGIDGPSGERRWRRKGADPSCPLVNGADQTASRTLCVVGGARIDRKGRDTRYEDVSVELQGIDPATGEVTWAYEIRGADAERAYIDEKAPYAPYGVVLPTADGFVALDQRDGTLEAVADETVLLCPVGSGSVTVYGEKRSTGSVYGSCEPGGRPTEGAASQYAVAAVGTGDGDVRWVSERGGVVAYRLG